ncbi:glycosyltransferase family 1 protein [Georgenia sp. TF02-10]|uniref:glycosyltransferase family 1 protein n=1 Tax=Georgenia sp. TF02-10 TaxID=2917725 RepID=UPI001FA6EC9C|nr:glycosyltransferase family 1 protein [Georgenia sp. TF02-10]UNX55736.1 glycosyltransferase family 1 protein [Georgenia sp. TF02-10]
MSAGAPGRTRPRLLVLSFSDITADARVLRQVRLLADDYELTTCGYGEAPDGVAAHVRIPDHLVHWHKDRALLLQRRFAAVYAANAVVAHLRERLPREHFDIVLADDADTVPLALSLRPRLGVHADLHEYAPRENEESWRWRWFVAPYYRWLVRTFVTRAASVTTVSDGLAAEYRREFGIDAGVVINAAAYRDAAPTPVARPVRLVHSGLARRNRRLELMTDAVERTGADVTLDLYLMPNDPAYLAELRERTAGSARVTVRDPVPHAELVGTLAGYDVGVFVLPPATFSYRFALPNKLFDYVQARLGVLVGPSPEMAAVVRQHRLGAVTAGFTTADVVAALDALDPAAVAGWKRASDAAARPLSAEVQVQGWARAVADLRAADGG